MLLLRKSSTTWPRRGFAQRNGNGTQKAEIGRQKAQKMRSMRSFSCFLCPLLCLLCSVPFPVGQSSVAATFDFRAHATRVSGSGTIVHPASQILLIHLRPSTHFIA